MHKPRSTELTHDPYVDPYTHFNSNLHLRLNLGPQRIRIIFKEVFQSASAVFEAEEERVTMICSHDFITFAPKVASIVLESNRLLGISLDNLLWQSLPISSLMTGTSKCKLT